jgi:hypothetical protein
MAGFYEHGNESSGFIKKAGYFFDKLSDYQLFKYCPAPWSK